MKNKEYEQMQTFSEKDFVKPYFERDALMRTEGRAEGERLGILSVAKNMLQGNFSLEDIAKYTNLSIEEIEKECIENEK